MNRTLRSGALLLACLLPASLAHGQTPSEDGQWGGEVALPLPGIHAVLLPPDGKLLLYSYKLGGGSGTECWIFDPETLALSNYPLATNVFCGGHSHMVGGDILVVGGVPGHFNTGHEKTFTFNEATGFTEVGSMATGRWYPTVTKLPDGRFITFAGLDQGGNNNPLVEIYDPASKAWSIVPGADKLMPLYPMSFLLSSGDVVIAGPHRKTEVLDIALGQWTFVDTPYRAHHEGAAVLIPNTVDQVMTMGGHDLGSTRTFKACEILDLSQPTPKWRLTAPMNRRRQHHNAIVLPDATVLVIGGRQIEGDIDIRPDQPPFFRGKVVREAEVYDPITETWTLLANQARPRLYHSTGILLRDARVLTAGGELEPSAEVFSPPYLFKGPRPTLSGQPGSTSYGATFTVQSSQADKIVSACLIAPGAVTHSFGQNQRYVPVGVQYTGGTSVDLTMPTQPTIAPPGYYMLFLLNDLGVPSVGEFVHLN